MGEMQNRQRREATSVLRVFYVANKGNPNYYDTHFKARARSWTPEVLAACLHFGFDPSRDRLDRAVAKRVRRAQRNLHGLLPVEPVLEEPGSKRAELLRIIKRIEQAGGGNIAVVGPDGLPGIGLKELAAATMAHLKKKGLP